MGQRDERLLVVLARGLELGTIGVRQGFQQAIAPARLVGDKHDAAGIAYQQRVGALAPFALQFRKFELHHHGAEKLAAIVGDRTRQKVAGNPAGHTHRIEAPGTLAASLAEIGAKAVVVADVAAGQAPVAGGHRKAGAIEQLEGGRLCRAVDFFEFAVQ
ncbi:hypothetical protein D3C80_1684300 [compost metagenome]